MSGPGDKPFIEHTPPAAFPKDHFTAVSVPAAFARAVAAEALKNGMLFEDQLLAWAQAGAECARLHQARDAGRKKRK